MLRQPRILVGGIAIGHLAVTVLLLSGQTGAEEPRDVVGLETFSRPALLDRFDKDQDEKLNDTERGALLEAFGIAAVPMLPAQPYRYSALKLPSYLDQTTLRETDNTPKENPLTDAGATLGRVLFYDQHLSVNNVIACASCHLQSRGFADPRQFSVGFNGGRTGRNAMGLVNIRFTHVNRRRPGFFWDERAATLEDQVLMPIQDRVEMGMRLDDLETKLQTLPYYAPLFSAAFGNGKISADGIAKAVAQFMRSMASFDSKYDRAAEEAGGNHSHDFDRFSAEENFGKSLFIDGVDGVAEIGCAHCHLPPTFGMAKSMNNGLDLVYTDQGLGARNLPKNDPFTPSNDGKFKAPSLRNIELTAPYMHDGRFQTLHQVVEHYSSRVHPHPNVGLAFNGPVSDDLGTAGFRLSPEQSSALVAFLKTLTDHSFVSDPRFSDPFIRGQVR